MPTTEMFTTTFGKEVTVEIDDSGEPIKFSWNGPSELTESDLSDINEWIEDYGDD